MASIYGKRSENLSTERDGLSDEELAQVEQLEMMAAGDPRALAHSGGAGDESVSGSGTPPPADVPSHTAQPARAPAPASAPVESAAGAPGITLNVYGEERVITQEAANAFQSVYGDDWQARVQRDEAAEVRHRALADRERQLNEYHGSLDQYRDRVVNYATDHQIPGSGQPATTADPQDSPPATGVSQEELTAKVRDAMTVVYDGDLDRGTEAMVGLLTDVQQGPAQGRTPPSAEVAREAANLVRQDMREEERAEQQTAANQVFRDEFSTIYANPAMMSSAQSHMKQLIGNAANNGKTYEQLARETGQYMLESAATLVGAPTPPGGNTPPVTPASDELAGRRQLKARTPMRPGGNSQRAPLTEPEPPPPSGSDIVKQMRVGRNQPVV